MALFPDGFVALSLVWKVLMGLLDIAQRRRLPPGTKQPGHLRLHAGTTDASSTSHGEPGTLGYVQLLVPLLAEVVSWRGKGQLVTSSVPVLCRGTRRSIEVLADPFSLPVNPVFARR